MSPSCSHFILLFFNFILTTQSLSVMSKKSLRLEWSEFEVNDRLLRSNLLPRRSGHVAWTAADQTVFVFGGYAEDHDSSRYAVNDLWKWKDGWSRLDPAGDIPGPRIVSAGALLGDAYFLFGGWDPQSSGTGGTILDEVSKVQNNRWKKLPITLPNGPASRHIVVALDTNTALFHNHRCTDHVFVFHAENQCFTKVLTSGEAPSSRGLHAACTMGKYVVMFGGAAQGGTMSDEAFLLDTDIWHWTLIRVGDGPTPRAAPCMCEYSQNCIILFGGAEATEAGLNPRGDVWALHIDTHSGEGSWELLWDDDKGGNGPQPRNAATLCEIEREANSKSYLLTGGWVPFRETWGDNFVLKITSD